MTRSGSKLVQRKYASPAGFAIHNFGIVGIAANTCRHEPQVLQTPPRARGFNTPTPASFGRGLGAGNNGSLLR